ncbi:hypothetical protein ACVXG7_00955 [Enterobacter hormaechei]
MSIVGTSSVTSSPFDFHLGWRTEAQAALSGFDHRVADRRVVVASTIGPRSRRNQHAAPSTSYRYAPSARSINSGVPPTPVKAPAPVSFTPPGIPTGERL